MASNASNGMSPRVLYLTAYNLVFAALWASVFVNTVLHIPEGKERLFDTTEAHARWVQTLSLFEIVHSAIGTCNRLSTPSGLQ